MQQPFYEDLFKQSQERVIFCEAGRWVEQQKLRESDEARVVEVEPNSPADGLPEGLEKDRQGVSVSMKIAQMGCRPF